MQNIQEIYESSLNYYNHLADLIEKVYDAMKRTDFVKISKKKVMQDYDKYMQALLIKVASSDYHFDQVELEFIRKITRYHDYCSKYFLEKGKLAKEDEKDLKYFSENTLQEVPLFIQMLSVADSSLKEEGKEEHYSKEAFTDLLNIVLGLSNIDLNVEQAEMEQACAALSPIMDFFNANKIEFLPKGDK